MDIRVYYYKKVPQPSQSRPSLFHSVRLASISALASLAASSTMTEISSFPKFACFPHTTKLFSGSKLSFSRYIVEFSPFLTQVGCEQLCSAIAIYATVVFVLNLSGCGATKALIYHNARMSIRVYYYKKIPPPSVFTGFPTHRIAQGTPERYVIQGSRRMP